MSDRTLVLSPLASVRWSAGRLDVLTPSTSVIAAPDARILTVLHAFATAATIDGVCAAHPELPASFVRMCAAMLTDHGVLVEAGAASPPDDTHTTAAHAAAIAAAAAAIARDSRALAGSIAADVDARVGQVRDALVTIACELRRERRGHVDAQLAALGLSARSTGLKLHLGCGGGRLDGWINVDTGRADLSLDLGWGLPFDAGAASRIYMAHVLEHFYYPDEASALLTELHRVLEPGGVLRLVVPDIRKCIEAYAAADDAFFARRKTLWPAEAECPTPLAQFLQYAGAGVRPGVFWAHKYGYDFETLRLLLSRCGFAGIAESSYMDSRHPDLRVDDVSVNAGFHAGGTHYSLFVDATK